MTVWHHQRKGRISGTEIPQDETSEWIFVTIDEDVSGYRDYWVAGETMTLRRSLMTLVSESGGSDHA